MIALASGVGFGHHRAMMPRSVTPRSAWVFAVVTTFALGAAACAEKPGKKKDDDKADKAKKDDKGAKADAKKGAKADAKSDADKGK